MNEKATTAVHRFGLGAMPGEIARAENDPLSYVLMQLQKQPVLKGRDFKSAVQGLTEFREYRAKRQKLQKQMAAKQKKKKKDAAESGADMNGSTMSGSMEKVRLRSPGGKIYRGEIRARLRTYKSTKTPFLERLCLFWANHFAIEAKKGNVIAIAGAYEREAIRPHITGNFTDMLLAAEQHPAMLIYLDNIRSTGPNSRIGKRRKKGLNENLAREILELHTLGVDGGYDLNDIQELAKSISGWTVSSDKTRRQKPNRFYFNPRTHEPGTRQVLGKKYRATNSIRIGENVLRDLAVHPSTARFISLKLARYFIADVPPKSMVADMEKAFLATGGELNAVYEAMLSHKDAFETSHRKFKAPIDFVASTIRGLGAKKQLNFWVRSLDVMGQPTWNPPAPKGWSDMESEWKSTDGLKTRLDFSIAAAAKADPDVDVVARAEEMLGATLRDETLTAVKRAADNTQGLTLILMSPEFQYR